jgi:hypothetical protein
MSDNNSVKRYELDQHARFDGASDHAAMALSVNGDWVSFQDYKEQADRIEQLAATNEELSNCVAVLEGKLNKAMGALEKVQAFVRDLEPHADQGHTLVPALREACEILIELKQGA